MLEQSFDLFANLMAYAAGVVWGIAVLPGSFYSIWALGTAFCIALIWYRFTGRRQRGFRQLVRLILPRGYLRSKSAKADWLLLLLGHTVFLGTFLTAIVNIPDLSRSFATSLGAFSGQSSLFDADPTFARIATTLITFLAYEFAYFFDHWLMHRFKFLWEFHKVHHTATSLSPFTLARMHPVDAYLYALLSITIVGLSLGLCLWVFGPAANPFTVDGANIILFVSVFALMTLQHSHVWISFRGWLGRTLLSPAHHQIHHSANPRHFNSNYGNVLAIWDWIFGTLRTPSRKSPRLRFGVDDIEYDPHSLQGLLLNPFAGAAAHIVPKSTDIEAGRRAATDKL